MADATSRPLARLRKGYVNRVKLLTKRQSGGSFEVFEVTAQRDVPGTASTYPDQPFVNHRTLVDVLVITL